MINLSSKQQGSKIICVVENFFMKELIIQQNKFCRHFLTTHINSRAWIKVS